MKKTVVLELIVEATESGKSLRTLEIRKAYQHKTGEFPEIGSDQETLQELKDNGKIKFLTEPWRDFCWLVPVEFDGPPCRTREEVKMQECELFF